MLDIFGRIKAKAQAAFQSATNFIDRDKTMPGMQLAQGGLGNRIQQGVQNWQAKPSNQLFNQISNNLPTTTEKQARINLDLETMLGKNTPATKISQGFNNWFSAPLYQIPERLEDATTARREGNALGWGMNMLGAVGGAIPGIDDAAIAAYNAVKNKASGRSFIEGLAGNEYAGLGDAATGGQGGAAADVLNMAELPIILLAGAKVRGKMKGKGADSLDNILNAQETKNAARMDDLIQMRKANELMAKPKQLFSKAKVAIDDIVEQAQKTAQRYAPKNKATMIAGEEGIIPLKKPINSTQQFEQILDATSDVKPGGVQKGTDAVLSLPSPEKLPALPMGEKGVSLKQLRRVVAKGETLDGKVFIAKNADEVREARRLGMPMENIRMADAPAKESSSLFGKDGRIYQSMDDVAKDELASTVKDNNFNLGNRVTKTVRDFFFDTKANLKKTFGGLYDSKIAPIMDGHEKRMAEAVDWKNKYRNALKGLNIKAGSVDDMLLREVGTPKGYEKVVAQVGEPRARELKEAHRQLRGMYGEIYDTVNAARRKAGLKELPFKKDFLSQVGSGRGGMLDAVLEGGVDAVAPVSQTIFKKQGSKATTGAIESMAQYLEYAARAGFTDLSAGEIASLRKSLGQAKAPREALEQLSKLEENILGTAGKGNWERVTGKMKSAAVVGKVSTLVNQFLAMPQGLIASGPVNFIKGQFSKEAKTAIANSKFLKVVGDAIPQSLRTGNQYTKAVGLGGDALQAGQQATNKTIWKGFFQQGRKAGLSVDEAVKYADELVPKIVGDRRLGMGPQVYNTLFGKIFGAFTIEPTAATARLMGQLKQAVSKLDPKAAGEVVGTVVAWHFMNGLYKKYGPGYEPYPDMIEGISDAIEYLSGSDTKKKDEGKALARIFSETLQYFPAVNNAFNTAYSFAETAKIVPDSREVFGQDDNTWMNVGSLYNPLNKWDRNITGNKAVDVPINIASKFFPGVEQGAKTLQAAISLGRGYSETKSGDPMYSMSNNPLEQGKALAFGQNATQNARDFFENDFSGWLTDKQKAVFEKLGSKEDKLSFLESTIGRNENLNRVRNNKDSVGGILAAGEASKEGYLSKPQSNAEAKENAAFIQEMLDSGQIPSKSDLSIGLFNDHTATDPSIEKRMDVYKSLKKVMSNEYYSDEQKEAVLKASGASKESYGFYELASKDTEVKLQNLLPKLDGMEDKERLETLMMSRMIVGGSQLLNNTMVNYLYEMDYISESEKKLLTALRFDEVGNKFYLTKSYKGSGGGKKLTYKQARELYKVNFPNLTGLSRNLTSFMKSMIASVTQKDDTGDRLLSSILTAQPKRSTRQDLWF
jgi:hypothetical protein